MSKYVAPMPKFILVTAFGNKQIKSCVKRFNVDYNNEFGLAFRAEDEDKLTFVMFVKEKSNLAKATALIAHESYHIACQYFRLLQEEKPSEEVMAYTIDAIFYEAVRRYLNV
jgi:hypothetical protein